MSLPPPIAGFLHATADVVDNVQVARDTHRLRIHHPAMAARFRPGQFLMLRDPRVQDPLLGRAFALYDVFAEEGQPACIDIVYLVVGKMTLCMAAMNPGDCVEVWGPLGNGFPDYSGVDHLILVAGGIGQTPFVALAKQALGLQGYAGQATKRQVERVSLFYGARNEAYLAGLDDFAATGCEIRIATDDGSKGFKGFVTECLDSQLSGLSTQHSALRLVGCGPEPMLHALAVLAKRRSLRCDLSLETPMACGVGVCFSCVTKVQCDGEWDYRRVCVEGPVFDAASLVW